MTKRKETWFEVTCGDREIRSWLRAAGVNYVTFMGAYGDKDHDRADAKFAAWVRESLKMRVKGELVDKIMKRARDDG